MGGESGVSEHGIRLSTGTIEHGIDTVSYHTINVETGYDISVIRRWRPIDLEGSSGR